MIANMNKSNTGKLLVSVMAMALVIAGAAVMLSDDVQGAVGNSYTLESEKKPLPSMTARKTTRQVIPPMSPALVMLYLIRKADRYGSSLLVTLMLQPKPPVIGSEARW